MGHHKELRGKFARPRSHDGLLGLAHPPKWRELGDMAAKAQLQIGTRTVALSNLQQVLYPTGKFSKAQVIDYYVRVAPFLLPHFRERPVTLKRFPDGIHGEAFYEKDAPGFTPEWVETFPVPRRDPHAPPIRYVLINETARSSGRRTWHASSFIHSFIVRRPSTRQRLWPSTSIPGEGTNILDCAEAAFLLRDVLTKIKLKCFPKVSGSKGIQVYVPLNVPVSYAVTQPFAQAVAELMAQEYPDRIVSEMAKSLRTGKVFIDWSQNADHKTTIGVYSLRAKSERPNVSMPVRWEELRAAMRRRDAERLYWTADEALKRLQQLGDLFAPVLKLKQQLPPQFAITEHMRREPSVPNRWPNMMRSGTSCALRSPLALSLSAEARRAAADVLSCKNMRRVSCTMICGSKCTMS